ncbi:MAG: hypothetical protein PHS44_04365 [Candidatus Dojkabacteria bacterium]|nr:hypothetical protein [Candidatus Dojkabacteria bacterium]
MKLQKIVSDKLICKIKTDLQQGTKILGNFSNQNDSIRVWTRYKNIEFGIVATSSRRFQSSLDLIEIQAFLPGKEALRMTILNNKGEVEISLKRLEKNFTPASKSETRKAYLTEFLDSYLNSEIDKDLNMKYFERSFRNPSQYKHLDPGLIK